VGLSKFSKYAVLGNDLFKSNLEALKHLTEKKTTPQHPQGIEDTL